MDKKKRNIIISSLIVISALGLTGFGVTYAVFQKSAEVGKTIFSDGYKKAEIFVNPKWGDNTETWDYHESGKDPVYYAYVWKDGSNSITPVWIAANTGRNSEHNYIVFHISTNIYDRILFARVNPDYVANLTTKNPASGTIWNQTYDLVFAPETNNVYNITSWHADGPQGTEPSQGNWSNSLYTRPASSISSQ